jgi:hypothetical protein
MAEYREEAMTITETAKTITDRFSCLIPDLLTLEVKGNILTLSGSIMAVSAVERHIMFCLCPNHCKFIMRSENYEERRAIYTYKF